MCKETYRATHQTTAPTFTNAPVLWRARTQDALSVQTLRHKPSPEVRANRQSYTITHAYPTTASDSLTPAIRVLLVDKYTIVRAGLHALLAQERNLYIVGETGQGAEAIRLAACRQPNVILIDLMIPDMDGIEAIRQLRQANPASQIVVLTVASDDQTVNAAIQAGAIGYLLKDVLKPDLLSAICSAARGEPTLHPTAQRALMHQSMHAPFKVLTAREQDVLRLIAQGLCNRDIAATLFLTEGTIKGYVSTILAKLQVVDRTQAALYAVKHGLNQNYPTPPTVGRGQSSR